MAGGDPARAVSTELAVLAAGLNDGPVMKRALEAVGMFVKKAEYVEDEVRRTPAKDGSLADLSMSGWRRKNPIVITGRYNVEGSALIVTPMPRTLGPMRVLEDGRKAATKGSVREYERTYRSKKTGEVTRRTAKRKVKRTSVGTVGKKTWTHVEQAIERDALNGPAEVFMNTIARELGG